MTMEQWVETTAQYRMDGLSQRQRKQQYFVKPACIPIRRPMTLFVPIPETGDPYIFLD